MMNQLRKSKVRMTILLDEKTLSKWLFSTTIIFFGDAVVHLVIEQGLYF